MGYKIIERYFTNMKIIERYGETYYSCSEIYEFIDMCNSQNRSILSIEFYNITEGDVIPYNEIQSIDSSDLINTSLKKTENVLVCNYFIKDCVMKCYKLIEDKYFTV